MEQDYPTQQIIKFIYRELPALEHLETEYAIENIPLWKEIYFRLVQSVKLLPKVKFFPRQRVVNKILSYSKVSH